MPEEVTEEMPATLLADGVITAAVEGPSDAVATPQSNQGIILAHWYLAFVMIHNIKSAETVTCLCAVFRKAICC